MVGIFTIFGCEAKQISKTDLYGQWQIENVTYTFTADSLFIDEIDVEGDEYTYTLSNNIISTYSDIYGKMDIMIEFITETRMRIRIISADDEMITEVPISERTFTLTRNY